MADFDQLSPSQRKLIIAAVFAELTLKLWAAIDLRRRPESQIRGRKRLWAPALLINFFGPVAYLAAGRKQPERG